MTAQRRQQIRVSPLGTESSMSTRSIPKISLQQLSRLNERSQDMNKEMLAALSQQRIEITDGTKSIITSSGEALTLSKTFRQANSQNTSSKVSILPIVKEKTGNFENKLKKYSTVQQDSGSVKPQRSTIATDQRRGKGNGALAPIRSVNSPADSEGSDNQQIGVVRSRQQSHAHLGNVSQLKFLNQPEVRQSQMNSQLTQYEALTDDMTMQKHATTQLRKQEKDLTTGGWTFDSRQSSQKLVKQLPFKERNAALSLQSNTAE